MNYSFPKINKLCSQLEIQKIFKEGKGFGAYPFFFNLRFVAKTDNATIKVVVMVSKKKYKKAVDRNRIKRQCRELYRLNQLQIENCLLNKENITLHLGINYISSQQMEYKEMEVVFKSGIKKLCNEIEKIIS